MRENMLHDDWEGRDRARCLSSKAFLHYLDDLVEG
jgi:hypothetical protein